MESRKTRRKQLAENTRRKNWSKMHCRKLFEKQLAKNSSTENSWQAHEIISAKYGANFVTLSHYQNNYHTINYKSKTFRQIIQTKIATLCVKLII